MAVTVDAVYGGTTGGTNANTVSWTHTTASGATLLLVSVEYNDWARTTSSVTYAGTAMTLVSGSLARSGTSGTDRHAELWSLISPTSGSQTIAVTVTAGGGTASMAGTSTTFFGSDTTTPLGTAAAAGGTGASASVTVASGASDAVFTAVATRASAATAPSGSASTIAELASTNVYGASAVLPGGTTTVTWTQSASNSYAVTAVPVTASTGSPSVFPADSLPLTDAVAVAQNVQRSPADTLGLTDAVTAVISLVAGGADTLGLTDAASVSVKATRAIADQLGLTDAVTATLNTPPPTAPPFPTYLRPPDPYTQAVRSGGISIAYTVDASRNGQAVAGATGMQPIGGQITDTTKPGVRRMLSLDLAPEPGLFDLLAPIGTTLVVTAKVTYLNKSGVLIPMGVFDVDAQSLTEGGGKLSLTAPDKWQRIVRAKFVGPTSSMVGFPVTQQIASLIQGALGGSEAVTVTSTTAAKTPVLTWTDGDRAKAILDLARDAGLWVSFDRFGQATIADLSTVKPEADWLIDASPSGVLLDLDRQRSRTSTYNVVVVESSAASGPAFTTQYVWDSDPASPTYAGPDPINHPELAGPFGVVPYAFDTPLPLDAPGAQATGLTILSRTVGLSSQVSLSTTPNPAIDSFDAIDVLPPLERYDIQRVLERHVADTVTHSLIPNDSSGMTHIDGRNTRTDAYT